MTSPSLLNLSELYLPPQGSMGSNGMLSSAESLMHRTLDKLQQRYFHFHIPLILHHTSFHFNIPEIEMGLAIDDKKAPCHSLIGGIFFLRELHESLCLQLTMSQALGNQTAPGRRGIPTEDLTCCVLNIVATTGLVQDKPSAHFRDTGSLQRESGFTFTHLP